MHISIPELELIIAATWQGKYEDDYASPSKGKGKGKSKGKSKSKSKSLGFTWRCCLQCLVLMVVMLLGVVDPRYRN